MDADTIKLGSENSFIWDEKAITFHDSGKLLNLIADDIKKGHISPNRLHALYLLAVNSKKYNSNKISSDVITLNSEFIIVTQNLHKQLVKIVFPKDIKEKHNISVYSPIGIACLGAKEKDNVFVKQGVLLQQLLIEQIVFQPEREKIFDL